MSKDATPSQTTLTPQRQQLGDQIQALCAGHAVQDVLAALADRLGEVAGFASASPAAAECLLSSLVPDMARDIRDNWPAIRDAKARCGIRGEA